MWNVSDLLGTGMMMEDLKVWGTPSDSTYFRALRTCVCQLKGSVRGVTEGFQRCVCVQTIKPGTKDVKAVWKVGIMGYVVAVVLLLFVMY